MKRRTPERTLHGQVAAFLRRCGPPQLYWTTIPGGDGRMTRAPGYRAGTPDLLLVYRGKPIGIELKAPVGRQSQSQKLAEMEWTLAGGLYLIARTLDEVCQQLECAGVPLRGRVGA